MATQRELERQVAELSSMVTGLRAALGLGPTRHILPLEERPDYIRRGSPEHAAFLGLIEDESSETGYRLADTTQFGPQVTDRYLYEVLRQKVSELHSETPPIQSDDPLAPNYAPPMWQPIDA